MNPLSWFRVHPARVMAWPGVARLDDGAFAVMWRFAMHSWDAGPVPRARAAALCGGYLEVLLAAGVLELAAENMVVLGWLEQERSDSLERTRDVSEIRRRAANVRWSMHEHQGASHDMQSDAKHATRRDVRTKKTQKKSSLALADLLKEEEFAGKPELEPFERFFPEWSNYRREIKHPLTTTTVRQELRDALAWGVQTWIEQARTSIANGWQGVFEPRRNGGGATHGGRPIPKSEATTAAEIARYWKAHGGNGAAPQLPEENPL